MKRVIRAALVFIMVLAVISVSASAFWPFDDLKDLITGKATNDVSCDVKASRSYLPASDFFTDNTARMPVFGSASGSFNDDTYVEIDCNVKNAKPEPLQKIVKAKKTFTSSELHYSGDCKYSAQKENTKYAVSAKIYPGGVECVGAVDATTVSIEGTGKGDKEVVNKECGELGAEVCERNKCDAPYVHDGYGKCAKCPSGTEYKEGKCVGRQKNIDLNPPEQKPVTPIAEGNEPIPLCAEGYDYVKTLKVCLNGKGEQKRPNCEYSVFNEETKSCPGGGKKPDSDKEDNKKKVDEDKKKPVEDDDKIPILEDDEDESYEKYGLPIYAGKVSYMGMPYEDSKIVESTCDLLKYYVLDAKKKKYNIVKDPFRESSKYDGQGIAIKSKKDCKLIIGGKRINSQAIKLEKGWNFISSQAFSSQFEKQITSDCKFKTSLIRINHLTHEIQKEKAFMSGYGFFVKVENSCTIKIGANDEDEIPLLK